MTSLRFRCNLRAFEGLGGEGERKERERERKKGTVLGTEQL
jgi:hypothetical protein